MKRFTPVIVLAALLVSVRVAVAEPRSREALVTCLAADANHEPIWPTKSFPVSGKQMVCVFRLGDDDSFTELTSKWVAVDVGDAAPANTLIAEGDLNLQGQKSGKLRYSQPGPLPVGKYRLDVLGDGKPWKSVEFEVAADPEPLQVKPAELLPLKEGKTWTYELVQEPGPGVKLSAAGEKLDKDGKLRATVTIAVAKVDKGGAEVVVKRNGKTITREWWSLDAKGMSATRRQAGAEAVARLDPPQPLLPVGQSVYSSWTYTPKDRSFTQSGQIWAALPIKGTADDEEPGYLTVMEQATPVGKTTVERHWLPGVGMVRELTTSVAGPKLLSRQTLTLVAPEQ